MKILLSLTMAATVALSSFAYASSTFFQPRSSGAWTTAGFIGDETAWCTTQTTFTDNRGKTVGRFSIGIRVSDFIDNKQAQASINIIWPSLFLLRNGAKRLYGRAVARVNGSTIKFDAWEYEVQGDRVIVDVSRDFVENVFRKGSWLKFYVTDLENEVWVKLSLRGTDVAGEINRQCRDTFVDH